MIIPQKAETAAIRELFCKVSLVILNIAQRTEISALVRNFYVYFSFDHTLNDFKNAKIEIHNNF